MATYSVGGGTVEMSGPCVPGQVIINGVDVCAQKVDPNDKKKADEAHAKLTARFPGVIFTGSAVGAVIDEQTKIAKGAEIELSSGLKLRNAKIAASAHVSGAVTIQDSAVAGAVSGAVTLSNGSDIGAGADVSGAATLSHVQMSAGARISGAVTATNTTLAANASISGAVTSTNMKLLADSSVSGAATVSGFTVQPGQVIDGGEHIGKFNAKAKSRSVMVTGNFGKIVVGNGATVSIGNVVNGVRVGGR